MVLVDEASLAGTLTLDALTAHAAEVGAKVVLVGDWAQLAAIDSGGAFGMLVRERDDAPELTEVRRFHAEWEKTASLHLRLGQREAITAYATHDRLHDGDTDQMVEAAYQAWLDDLNHGRSSVLVAESREMVTELNTRARLDRITTADVHPDGTRLHDGTLAGTGDLIVTRRNDRRLTTGLGWVKNGDRWEVLRHHDDGSLTVRRHGANRGGTLTLPAAYVRDDVELAYATTAHRAQGLTVDTAHVIVDNPGMTREALYVALTRGRSANHAYVATDAPGLEPHQREPHDEPTAASVLAGILRHEGAEKSAHETITSEQDTWSGIDHLAAQYETIAQTAQAERFTTALTNAGLSAGEVEQITDSDLFGPLIADLRAAHASGHDPENLLTRAVAAGDLDKAENPGTLLRYRVNRLAQRPPAGTRAGQQARMIAGLIPEATGPMPEDMHTALTELADHITQRAETLAEQAIENNEEWTTRLGPPPADPRQQKPWRQHLATIAAYRDRHHITSPDPLGTDHTGVDRLRAQAALQHLHRLGRQERRHVEPARSGPGREL